MFPGEGAPVSLERRPGELPARAGAVNGAASAEGRRTARAPAP
jgi:hypothetical protein